MFTILATAALAAEPDWHQLYAPRATATSFLRSNFNRFDENYHPNFAFDDNPATAWVEGVDGDGVGQVLSWDVSALSTARAVKLRVRNGYQKSSGLLAANGAPTKVELSAWKGREVVAKQEFTLTATDGWQDLVLSTGGKGLSHLELKVLSVRTGSKYADTCISDIQTFVDSDLSYDAAWEKSRKAELTTWIAGRVEAAKSATQEGWPFAATSWNRDEKEATAAEVEAMAAPLRALAPSVAHLPRQRPTAKAPVLPDGIEFVLSRLGLQYFLQGSKLTVFESTDGMARKEVEECDGDCWTEWRDLRVQMAADGRTPVLATMTYAMHEDGRMLYTENAQLVLTWDQDGHLTQVLEEGKAHEEAMDGDRLFTQVIHLTWRAGKIVEMEHAVHARPERPGGEEDWIVLTRTRWTPAAG
ncbi:MAG: hypothetical protein KC621_15325 [Myxococcales bacterium]|nr:hypothetical protein [Myxococcales bacterium]